MDNLKNSRAVFIVAFIYTAVSTTIKTFLCCLKTILYLSLPRIYIPGQRLQP